MELPRDSPPLHTMVYSLLSIIPLHYMVVVVHHSHFALPYHIFIFSLYYFHIEHCLRGCQYQILLMKNIIYTHLCLYLWRMLEASVPQRLNVAWVIKFTMDTFLVLITGVSLCFLVGPLPGGRCPKVWPLVSHVAVLTALVRVVLAIGAFGILPLGRRGGQSF